MMEALQRAVFSALTGDSTLMAMVAGVSAYQPQADNSGDEDEFPYVTIGEDAGVPWDSHTVDGMEATVQIDVWSRAGNYVEAKGIGDRIRTVLHNQSLTISGFRHVLTRMDTATYLIDPDGKTRRGLLLFRVVMTDL